MALKNLIVSILFCTTMLNAACEKKDDKKKREPAPFNGYWMVTDQIELLSQAVEQSSCDPILDQKELHQTEETISLGIISIWEGTKIFSLDTIIKKGSKEAQAHPKSVTVANVPGRYINQGTLFIIEDPSLTERPFLPSEPESFSLIPFEIENLEEKEMIFVLEEPNFLRFTMQSKKNEQQSIDPNSTPELTNKNDRFELKYGRISLLQYRDFVNLSQDCL